MNGIWKWLLMLVGLLFFVGCTATLTGGGELSVGMRNDNFLVMKHTVDGDKEGKSATSNLDVPAVEEWILSGNDGAATPDGN